HTAREHRLLRVEGVLARRDQDDEPAHHERDEHGQKRRDDPAGPLGEGDPLAESLRRLRRLLLWRPVRLNGREPARGVAHAATPLRPAPVIAMPSSSSLVVGGNSPTISHSYITRIRSDNESTSSSSSETRRIARPSSRSSIRRRWTNSIARTSSPRVG